MADRVNDKRKPGTSFSLNFPLSFSVSMPTSLKEELKKEFGGNGRIRNVSRWLKKDFLKHFFNTKNEVELLKKNKNIHNAHKELRRVIIDESGMGIKEFSEWSNKMLREYLEKSKKEQNEK